MTSSVPRDRSRTRSPSGGLSITSALGTPDGHDDRIAWKGDTSEGLGIQGIAIAKAGRDGVRDVLLIGGGCDVVDHTQHTYVAEVLLEAHEQRVLRRTVPVDDVRRRVRFV